MINVLSGAALVMLLWLFWAALKFSEEDYHDD
jgi:hypothetical protein